MRKRERGEFVLTTRGFSFNHFSGKKTFNQGSVEQQQQTISLFILISDEIGQKQTKISET